MEHFVALIALVITGPLVGVEIGVAVFTHPVIGRLPDQAFRQARGDAARVLGKVMPFWYVASLAALIATAVVTGNWLVITAAVLMALVLLTTVTLMVPINNRIGRWSDAAEADRDLARRWDRLHWLRVGLLIVLYGLLVISVS
ncbi:DUF1772 domain-containing protein [Mycolicibacterium celeriflavum]|uniref:Membrane protein n=1 Tax=Mycolicibacterium celeriflavum TaxID=1249101 RepID=A0A1X0BYM1_MYCCF|nr:DUF1772 domain-containing protein [Mycolicibacterium celeriflavum]MCV7236693.1 DUF1772 domain-containing protein [Mycolicibacterium celeriflavum]ORA49641.1 hypothetical protein BST21_07240 [Mycolicibacterium celeriflavum]BBY44060.1 membrane protein [Mycolicibacterium celeriflavum]